MYVCIPTYELRIEKGRTHFIATPTLSVLREHRRQDAVPGARETNRQDETRSQHNSLRQQKPRNNAAGYARCGARSTSRAETYGAHTWQVMGRQLLMFAAGLKKKVSSKWQVEKVRLERDAAQKSTDFRII